MKYNAKSLLAVSLPLVSNVAAQFNTWAANQVNTSICQWENLRATLVQDTVYLDGGSIYWIPGLDDGTLGTQIPEGNSRGFVLSYYLGSPFSPDTNVTGILVKDKKSKAIGSGSASGPALNFLDGALLGNDFQFFFYGGLSYRLDNVYDQPNDDQAFVYRAYQYGDAPRIFNKGFETVRLSKGVNRNVVYGGAASAPSENKAWYFSGHTSPKHGPMYLNYAKDNSTKASVVSNSLITVDLENQFNPKWRNDTIPKDVKVKGRAGQELVWVPVGEKGILVVLGGVTHPEWVEGVRQSADEDASEKESPEFMQTIDIYDVAGEKWYRQPSKNAPGPRARGCAVVAHSSDETSYNIYYYGGYDGLHPGKQFYDDVWVLSLPSFTWTQIHEGTSVHARAGHKCFKPYADQMMAFGGTPTQVGSDCLDKPIVLFNLTSGQWMDSYDPANFGAYGVPKEVQSVIGGNAAGGATKTAPSGGWTTPALGKVFEQKYNHSKITTYGPYSAESTPTERPPLPPPDEDGNGKSGLPSWVAPVLGVVIGLVLLTGAIVLFCLWRKRKLFFKKRSPSEPGTEDPHSRIANWMRGQPTPQPAVEKAPTVTTSELMPEGTPEIGHAHEVTAYSVRPREYYAPPGPNSHFHEMGDTQVMELDGSPRPAELGFTHVALNRRQSNKLTNPSSVSGNHSDLNDNVSQASGPIASGPVAEPGLVDSPTLAQSPADATNPTTHYASGVSMMSNAASHSRNISNTTVSSEGTHGEPRVAPERMSQPGVQSIPERLENQNNQLDEGFRASSGPLPPFEGPVSPPTEGEVHADEYFSAKQLVSPIVKNESDEERPLGRK